MRNALGKMWQALKGIFMLWSWPFTCALILLVVILFARHVPVKAQGPGGQPNGSSRESIAAGTYDSTQYKYGASILSGNNATGSQTITVCPGTFVLPDGRTIFPFASANGVFAPITVDAPNGAVAETVTPTASSLLYKQTSVVVSSSGFDTCANITASFSNLHGPSLSPFQIISGDQGIQEAINDASSRGGGQVYWQIDSGIVTLNTGGANTNLSTLTIPTRSTVMGATARVTTTIGTCAGGWSLGYSTGTEFTAANTTLTAGTTTDSSTLSPAVAFNAAATVPIAHCTTSNASAGALHARIWGYKMAAPAQ